MMFEPVDVAVTARSSHSSDECPYLYATKDIPFDVCLPQNPPLDYTVPS